MKHPLIAAKVVSATWCIMPETFTAIVNAVLDVEPLAMPIRDMEDEDDEDAAASSDIESTRVIPVVGILGKHLSALEMACGGCSVDRVSAMLADADNDSECQSIVLQINSPGGIVTGIPELAAQIADVATRKPVVAFTDYQCCSAALWLASQATAFYSTGSAQVGSVGAYIALLDETRRMELAGDKMNVIAAGKFKTMGASFKAMTDEERAMFQARVDAITMAFKSAVTARRTIAAENLEGQVFTGEEALVNGMVDGLLDSVTDAAAMAAQLTSRGE